MDNKAIIAVHPVNSVGVKIQRILLISFPDVSITIISKEILFNSIIGFIRQTLHL